MLAAEPPTAAFAAEGRVKPPTPRDESPVNLGTPIL